MSSLTILDSDFAEFYAYPHPVRADVRKLLAEFERMSPPLEAAWKAAEVRLGKSWRTIRRLYYEVQKRGWRGAIDSRKARAAGGGIPEALAQEFRRRVERFQRNGGGRSAYQALVNDWKNGLVIPGYEDVSPMERANYPDGWSYPNLMRAAKKAGTKAQLITARRGKAAAAAYLPQVFSSRVGLWPGSHLMWDDVMVDSFVLFRGKAVRVLEFDALDVFSGAKIDWIQKPRFEREDGVNDGLKEYQFRSLIAKVYGELGYSPRGTMNMVELGTAAMREGLEKLLFDRSGGLIRVKRAGIVGDEQSIAGLWRGAGKGNSKFKAPIESLRNLMHNRFSALPAQTGKDPEHRPESTAGLLKYNELLMRAVPMLPAHFANMLRLPLIPWEQFGAVSMALYDAINRRGEDPRFGTHDLEGWAELGHIITEFRLSASVDTWLRPDEFLALGAPEQSAITALVQGDTARYARTRSLSPREVWEKGRRDLVPLPDPVLAEIILGHEGVEEGPLAKVLSVTGAYFEFRDQLLGPGDHRYSAEITNLRGRRQELRHGEKYLCVVDPAGNRLFVHDAKGGFVGTAYRDERVSRADDEALKHKFGEVARRTGNALRDLSTRHRDQGEANHEMMTHNARVIEDAANPTKAEDARADRTARRAAEAGRAMIQSDSAQAPADESGEEHVFDARS